MRKLSLKKRFNVQRYGRYCGRSILREKRNSIKGQKKQRATVRNFHYSKTLP
ncbi:MULTISPECIES: hypothetical protein [unclassified Bartonella]|uniref:hypothetical protein n=1 Tax=unclassified Bartonella TaxID=2645622 RepID=UPI0035CEDCE6